LILYGGVPINAQPKTKKARIYAGFQAFLLLSISTRQASDHSHAMIN
jgi:hypothetical protein